MISMMIKDSNDFKKLKEKYENVDDENLIIAAFALGCIAEKNTLFKSVFEYLIKKDMKYIL